MDNRFAEIESNILSANFSRVVQLSEEWLVTLSPAELLKNESPATVAYQIGRFFLHRHDRIAKTSPGADRARLFQGFISELNEKFSLFDDKLPFSESVLAYCHGQIAEGLARAFAGQKSYNLNQEEIRQLAISLLEIGNYGAARETTEFLLQMNPGNAANNCLMACVLYHLQPQKNDYRDYLRKALFVRPELASEMNRYLPDFLRTWYSQLSPERLSGKALDRYFAMILEVNGIYGAWKGISSAEATRLEKEFRDLRTEYEKKTGRGSELIPRIIHYLTWLLQEYQQRNAYDKLEELRTEMRQLDSELWELFHKNVLSKEKK